MELPALLVFPLVALLGPEPKTLHVWIILGAWVTHYVNRSIIFPLRVYATRGMPVEVVISAFIFNIIIGSFLGYHFGFLKPAHEIWLLDIRLWAGLIIWVTGFSINLSADNILLALRSRREREGYQIPRGKLFRVVTCPNYLGEIIEWLGFLIMAWCAPASVFFVWVFANLTPRALAHRQWYRIQFPDYPEERKALFPWLL